MIEATALLDGLHALIQTKDNQLQAAMTAGQEMERQRDEAERKRKAAEKLRETTANASHKLRQRAEDAERRLGEQFQRAETAEAEARALREQVRTLGAQLDNVRAAVKPKWDAPSGGANGCQRIGSGSVLVEGNRKEDTIR